MSFVCDLVIGYFDPTAPLDWRAITVTRPLQADQVQRLQAACNACFGGEWGLIDSLTADGLIWVRAGIITEEMFRVACMAHECFEMTAVDLAHYCLVYPIEDWVIPDLEDLVADRRSGGFHYRDHTELRMSAERSFARMQRRQNFERATRQQVQSFAASYQLFS